MYLGLGLYRHMLDKEHYRFARQCGATHLVVHLVDYFNRLNNRSDQPTDGGRGGGWGHAGHLNQAWNRDEIFRIKAEIEAEELKWFAVENLDPGQWYDILLDGPQKEAQLEIVKENIRILGEAGISVLGYNFSLAGVYGRTSGHWARGGAQGVGMNGKVDAEPMPDGMVWNMTFNERAIDTARRTRVSTGELWKRLAYFLENVLPVAEQAKVILAAHPDDPPVPRLRDTPRLVFQPDHYQRLLDLSASPANQLEFCLGTIAEMSEGNVHDATRTYAAQGKIAYVHFRNIRGRVPNYQEVFVDEGDIDMLKVLRILKDAQFGGVLIPDHAPQMSCDAPWHAGMAFAMGYMRAALQHIEKNSF